MIGTFLRHMRSHRYDLLSSRIHYHRSRRDEVQPVPPQTSRGRSVTRNGYYWSVGLPPWSGRVGHHWSPMHVQARHLLIRPRHQPIGARDLPDRSRDLPEWARHLPERARHLPTRARRLPERARRLPIRVRHLPTWARHSPVRANGLPARVARSTARSDGMYERRGGGFHPAHERQLQERGFIARAVYRFGESDRAIGGVDGRNISAGCVLSRSSVSPITFIARRVAEWDFSRSLRGFGKGDCDGGPEERFAAGVVLAEFQ